VRELKLVLFDLDGTLVSLNLMAEKAREEIRRCYRSVFGDDDTFTPILERIEECERRIAREKGLEEAFSFREKALEILRHWEMAAVKDSRVQGHAKEVLRRIRERGVKTGVFSRNCREAVAEAIRKHELGPFDVVIAREDAEETKPSPRPVLLALKITGVHPRECLIVGDHPYDILSAKEAGVKAAGVLTGAGGREALENAGADYVFTDLAELYNAFFGGER